jgi:Ca-activated chloride channel family protein
MNAGLSFTAPGALFAFILFVPLSIFWLFRRRTLAIRFSAAGLDNSGSRSLGRRYAYSGVFFGIFLACLIAALAGPQWGSRTVMEYRRGLDVVFALDLSRSMEIRDMPAQTPETGAASRLEAGLRIARDAASASAGVRFAAALGKGQGVLAVPLTGDTGTILSFLAGLSGSSLTGRGTNLEALADAASSAFRVPFPSRHLIVLVSDGETLSGSLRSALERTREEGVMVTALGLGSDAGAPVPGTQDDGAEPVISRRQADVLRYAAERTGGVYIDGNGGDAAALLAEHFRSLAPETGIQSGRREPKPRWALFVFAAILAFGASKLCMIRGRLKVLSLTTLILFCSCSRVSGKLLIIEGNFFVSQGMYTDAASSYLKALEHDEAAPYADYGLGSVYFSLDEGAAALERYEVSGRLLAAVPAGEHRELRYRIPYNAGLVLFGEGDYAGAAAAFRAALEIDNGRIDAKRNLELSLLSLSREKSGMGQKEKDQRTDEAEALLFDYLRRKEQNQWKSREWIEEDTGGPDY